MTEQQPPSTLDLVWCPECGRTNRNADLRLDSTRHYSGGKVCPGKPEHLAYILDPTTTGAVITAGMVEAGARALAQADQYIDNFQAARVVLEAMAAAVTGDAETRRDLTRAGVRASKSGTRHTPVGDGLAVHPLGEL
jgi:hypothetical protein